MQVLQHTTRQVKDVETLQQISNDSLNSSSLPNSCPTDNCPDSKHTNGDRKELAPSSRHNLSHTTRNQAVVEVELEHAQTLFPEQSLPNQRLVQALKTRRVKAFLAAGFLVAVPVFIQAPLVRIVPTVSLAMTTLWLMLGWRLLSPSQLEGTPEKALWGDLIIGFSWTWLAGAVYWGWFRWDPYVHLPIESIGLPIVLTLLYYQKAKIGNYFYLGSLLGTAITDLYFYCVGLIPYWRALMTNPPESASAILHSALLRMETYQGIGCAIVLLTLLVMLGTIPLRSTSAKWWAFSGAVLSTILVDSLFFVAAILA
ncbi:MAG: DUF3120 domain-containing protein [Cyanobacteria bacterium J06623_4]